MREILITLLAKNSLLLLFAVAAIGYPIGRIKIKGISLGIAALLFTGIGFGAIDPRLKLPEAFYQLGLALFIYTIGLSSSPGFFAALNKKGLRTNVLSFAILFFGGLASVFAVKAAGLPTAMGVGMYTGAFTNSPALAASVEVMKMLGGGPDAVVQPVVAYSIAYPFSVVGGIVAILLVRAVLKIDYRKEAKALPASMTGMQSLSVRTICAQKLGRPMKVSEVMAKAQGHHVVFGRVHRSGQLLLPTGDLELQFGDEMTIVGTDDALDAVSEMIGNPINRDLSLDHSEFDYRRIFVSNPDIAGRPIRELELPLKHAAVITRVRRGDMDFVPNRDTVLELGDRVRVTSRRDNMQALTELFGDSYRALSEIDLLNFSLGLAIGLALGAIPVPLPGGITFKLGFAGGPLIAALILARIHRTGPIVWAPSYSANLTLRQIGLLLFAAGIGTTAGEGFAKTVTSPAVIPLLAVAILITFVSPALLLLGAVKFLKMPLSIAIGMLAGTNTQPVLLAFSHEQTGNDLPSHGYATVFPLATIMKVVLAQLLLLGLR